MLHESPPRLPFGALLPRPRLAVTAALALAATLAIGCRAAETTPAPETAAADDFVAQAAPADLTGWLEWLRGESDATLEGAHAELGDELVRRYTALADESRTGGDPASALPHLDRALRIHPDSRTLLLARAETLVELGDRLRAENQNGLYILGAYEDARRAYERAGRTPRALLGAAHTEWLLGDGARAHSLAEEAIAKLSSAQRRWAAGGADAAEVCEADLETAPFASPAAIRARAAGQAFAQRVQSGGEGRANLEATTRTAIDTWLAEAPGELEPWTAAVDFELWRDDGEAALTALLSGLRETGNAAPLEARLLDVATRARGPEGAADLLVARADGPDGTTQSRWLAARAQFDAARANLPSPTDTAASYPDQRQRFADAEQRFVEVTREFAPDDPRVAEALGWRVVARAGRGWVEYAELDLGRAAETFLSTNDLVDRGVEWRIDGSMRSALVGLQLVAERQMRAGDLESAAELLWRTHLLSPEDPLLASNAGLFLRDLGAALEESGRLLCHLARGETRVVELGDRAENLRQLAGLAPDGSEDRSPRALETASALIARGVEATERCFQAYTAAIRLSPEDPWILRDGALVLIYSLHRDLDQAVAWLERAIELARPLAEDEVAAEVGPGSATEVWGDAHENLGVYHSNFGGDMDRAAEHFQKALDIGPKPAIQRTWVRQWMEHYRAGNLDAARALRDVRSFGQPCD
ncbi:MAG: hypothetical protein GC161_10250 [Planctomycetaceae bacterium]|nr:hypothetical protein [Planctomycetaceae bacterium]